MALFFFSGNQVLAQSLDYSKLHHVSHTAWDKALVKKCPDRFWYTKLTCLMFILRNWYLYMGYIMVWNSGLRFSFPFLPWIQNCGSIGPLWDTYMAQGREKNSFFLKKEFLHIKWIGLVYKNLLGHFLTWILFLGILKAPKEYVEKAFQVKAVGWRAV